MLGRRQSLGQARALRAFVSHRIRAQNLRAEFALHTVSYFHCGLHTVCYVHCAVHSFHTAANALPMQTDDNITRQDPQTLHKALPFGHFLLATLPARLLLVNGRLLSCGPSGTLTTGGANSFAFPHPAGPGLWPAASKCVQPDTFVARRAIIKYSCLQISFNSAAKLFLLICVDVHTLSFVIQLIILY